MHGLIKELKATNCNFIRCLKPNNIEKMGFWNPKVVLN